ncbi:MAG: zinc ribbon domain-containing protein [Planctomycetes bacterium]|nr:zinc ribbon domain-containing protein [Planctomycetota bacterium]
MNDAYDFDDDEYDSADDDSETLPCPQCGQSIYEEADQCPYCGQYVTFSSSSSAFDNKPWWWIALGLLGVLAVLWWLVMAGR